MKAMTTQQLKQAYDDERENVESTIVLVCCLSVTATWVFFLASVLR